MYASLPRKPKADSTTESKIDLPERIVISLSAAPQKETKFKFSLSDGKYSATCFVKYSTTPACSEITMNGKKALATASPLKRTSPVVAQLIF